MSKGFTLIELLIAILILTIGIIGVYNVFANELVLTASASSRLVAAYLAQEGVEIARNIRDNNWIKKDFRPLTSNLDCTGWCGVDYIDGTLTPYTNDEVKIDGVATAFNRKVTITPFLGVAEAVKVSVVVTWGKEIFQVEEYLYNWY